MIKHEPYLSDDDGSFDDFLSAQLKQSQPYLMDNDFSANVMAKLPAAKRLSVWQERLIIVLPLVIISLLVLSQFSVLAIAVKFWTLLYSLDIATLLNIALAISATAICSASYWFAKQIKLI